MTAFLNLIDREFDKLTVKRDMGDGMAYIKKNIRMPGVDVEEYRLQRSKGLLWCCLCKTWQGPDSFYNSGRTTTGKMNRCRTCAKVQARSPERRTYYAQRLEAMRAYVMSVRAQTFCNRCGAQPIDWHHEDHVKSPQDRISRLLSCGSLKRIKTEIARCEALCRRCHMTEDGRLARLIENAPHVVTPPTNCISCGKFTKPIWAGKCRACYDRIRRRKDKGNQEDAA